MKRVLISGYYGFNNAGDEAVLAGLVAGLRAGGTAQALEITALSIDPSRSHSVHKIAAKHRYKDLLNPINKTDLFLSGGGSLLQDVTSAHGIFYYLAIVRLAQILGKKTMFIAQGIGPLIRQRSRKLTASVARKLDAITVRDEASAELLQIIGVKAPITVTADPALLLGSACQGEPRGALLSMREWPAMRDSFSTDLAHSLSRLNPVPSFGQLGMHGEGDRSAAARVLANVPSAMPDTLDEDTDFRSLMNKVSCSELVVAMRLHALIFAAAAGVPLIALSYDPKVDAFMHQIQQPDALISVTDNTTDEIELVVRRIWTSKTERSEALKARIPELRRLAQRNADIALELLK